jgi:hypothetical protein
MDAKRGVWGCFGSIGVSVFGSYFPVIISQVLEPEMDARAERYQPGGVQIFAGNSTLAKGNNSQRARLVNMRFKGLNFATILPNSTTSDGDSRLSSMKSLKQS